MLLGSTVATRGVVASVKDEGIVYGNTVHTFSICGNDPNKLVPVKKWSFNEKIVVGDCIKVAGIVKSYMGEKYISVSSLMQCLIFS